MLNVVLHRFFVVSARYCYFVVIVLHMASAAQSDALPTADQEVASSINPGWTGNILSWNLIMEVNFTLFLSLPLI